MIRTIYRGGSTLWLAASDKEEEQLWTWSTGRLAIWQGFANNLVPYNETLNSLILDRDSNAWQQASELEKHGFMCEAEPGLYGIYFILVIVRITKHTLIFSNNSNGVRTGKQNYKLMKQAYCLC